MTLKLTPEDIANIREIYTECSEKKKKAVEYRKLAQKLTDEARSIDMNKLAEKYDVHRSTIFNAIYSKRHYE